MIYTLTLNPAVDRELSVQTITFNKVLRASAWQVDLGGKGFNVSRMLKILGLDSVALGFAGGKSGELLAQGLQELGIATDFVWVAGETRTNVSIVSLSEGRYVKANEPGPTVGEKAQMELLAKVGQLARPGDWWVLAGSLPPGVPADYYGLVIKVLGEVGANSVLDTSGQALRDGCTAGPVLVKPNDYELGQLSGLPVNNRAERLEAARYVLSLGVQKVVVSLGHEGALMVDGDGAAFLAAPEVEEQNPIGAGDALVAGLVFGLSQNLSLAESLRWGVACGAAAASQSGTAMGSRSQVEEYWKRTEIQWLESEIDKEK